MGWTESVLFESRMEHFRLKVRSSDSAVQAPQFIEFQSCRRAGTKLRDVAEAGYNQTERLCRCLYITYKADEIAALLDSEAARINMIWPRDPAQAMRFRAWQRTGNGNGTGSGSVPPSPEASSTPPAPKAAERTPSGGQEQPIQATPQAAPVSPQQWKRNKRAPRSGRHSPSGKFILKSPLGRPAAPAPAEAVPVNEQPKESSDG